MNLSAMSAAPLGLHGLGYHGARAHPSPPTNFTFLDFPGTSVTGTYGINPGAMPNGKAMIVGAWGASTGGSYGFLLKLAPKKTVFSESYQTILPNLTDGEAFGINDDGHIVGEFGADNTHGFLLVHGKMTQIDVPYQGAAGTFANDINNAGTVVGAWYMNDGAPNHGFTWRNGVFTQVPDYPGASQTWPWGINGAGDLSGYVVDANGVDHGFLLKNGVYTLLDFPGAAYTNAVGLNDSDTVVGFYCMTLQECEGSGTAVQGFVYSNGTYTTVDYPVVPTSQLGRISNSGVMLGYYYDASGAIHGYLVNP